MERGASNQIHLDRLIEMIDDIEQGLELANSPDSTLNPQIQAELDDYEYGHEVVQHAQDGDICLEKGLHHLALSSYIHAIEWVGITHLNSVGEDIIEEEKNGMYYNLVGGNNSILNELKQETGLDQKTISQIESLNRAERRWMAHHKSGEVLPEEIDAVRARLVSLINSIF